MSTSTTVAEAVDRTWYRVGKARVLYRRTLPPEDGEPITATIERRPTGGLVLKKGKVELAIHPSLVAALMRTAATIFGDPEALPKMHETTDN